ncbi:hypothetical protein BO83DRAFT_156131 [Aspergillus eucalypticola CBS 122712]|uniref:Zn(2)-C6 fungal-type domain-containing protein n=1 Tax=Aspergillus eucalypticola (strain CBS 122712 / IBT 29274) TaxID=1448314 RepID=A0A317UQQ9_ASPEC|nr:uncharacterized protein BO83DRAFT_156131 [Aspergillus eucalypticola CBS 122712]PWY63689.1 hypothetical protein BO83DRAFT_156131 [Aspergillus eucalypticola CBS 122712]
MVNYGRSGGCVTCRERRVKCDEAKPKCRACHRLRLQCGGYKTKYANLKFKDQSHKFHSQSVMVRSATKPTQEYSLRPLSEPDSAVPFYLHHYARMGRDMSSARGFYEVLIPIYCSQQQDSALSLAVSAVASQVLSLWRHDNSPRPQVAYAQAVQCLRRTLQDSREWGSAATILAVLSLQLFETIAAIYGLRSSTQIHHNGAVSSLPLARAGDNNEILSAYTRQFILHSEICSAIRQGRQLQTVASSWIRDNGLFTVPDNPSAALDAIGVSVARLQAQLKLEVQSGYVTLSREALSEYIAKTRQVDQQLLTWTQCVPDHWQPLRLTNGWSIDSSIPVYQSTCEIYPSCQIATIWNLWRIQRILIIKMKLSLLDAQGELECDSMPSNLQGVAELQPIFQELVDGVCYSVPFYLGNLRKPLSIADFTDSTILFPSSHVLGHNVNWNKQFSYHPQVAVEEHRRHIIAQGPWHVMSPLSRLLTFHSEEYGPPMKTLFRPGQYEWIRDQFLRVTTLLHILPADANTYSGCGSVSESFDPRDLDTMAENHASRVRQGATFMSGP